MSADYKAAVSELIREIMSANAWSASRLAREAGLAPSTITRALDPQSPFVPSTATTRKLVPFLVSLNLDTRKQLADISTDLQYQLSSVARSESGRIPVSGDIRAGYWFPYDVTVPPEVPNDFVTFWDAAWDGFDVAIYRIGDHETDRVYPEGTYVAVHKVDMKVPVRPRQIYVIRRRANFLGGDKAELGLWDLVYNDEGSTLSSRSVSGEIQPIPKGDALFLGQGFDVIGQVLGFYHPMTG